MKFEEQSATEGEFNKYIFDKIKEFGFEDAIGFSYYQQFIEKENEKRKGFYPTYFKIDGEVCCNF